MVTDVLGGLVSTGSGRAAHRRAVVITARLWIRVGKWIMLKLFGTLDHRMKVYGLTTTALGLGILVPIFADTLQTIQTSHAPTRLADTRKRTLQSLTEALSLNLSDSTVPLFTGHSRSYDSGN